MRSYSAPFNELNLFAPRRLELFDQDWLELLIQVRRFWGPAIAPVLQAAGNVRAGWNNYLQWEEQLNRMPPPSKSTIHNGTRIYEYFSRSCQMLQQKIIDWGRTDFRAAKLAIRLEGQIDALLQIIKEKHIEIMNYYYPPNTKFAPNANKHSSLLLRSTLKFAQACKYQPRTTREALQILHLRPGFDVHALKEKYRASALRHHPDRGGSWECMTAINLSYQYLHRKLT